MTGKKILFWFGVFIVSLLVMVQPARAETIPATNIEQPATWRGSACGISTVSAEDACFKQLTTCGGMPPQPSTLSYSVVSWSVTAQQACRYVSLGGVSGGYGNVNTTCTLGTFDPATNKCLLLTCPANQNWTLSGSTCSRPDCVAPQVRQASTGLCANPAVTCPDSVSADVKGYVLTSSSNFQANGHFVTNFRCWIPAGGTDGCKVYGVAIASAFGITLAEQIPSADMCTSGVAPLTPTMVTLADPSVVKFQDVVTKAEPLSIEITTAATAASNSAAQVVQDRLSVVGSGVTDAYAKALAKETAAQEVQKAGQDFIANPTPATLQNYNDKMTAYNGKSVAADSALSKVAADWQILDAVKKSAQQQADAGAAVRLKIQQLQDAITASGQPFNTGDINAKIGDLAGLEAANASALGKLTDAIAKLQATKGDVTNITNNNITNSTTVNNTAAAVDAVASGAGSGTPASGVSAASAVAPASSPAPAPTSFCMENPTDPTCVPPPEPSSDVGAGAASGVYVAGTLNGGKTFGDVLTGFKGRVLAAPVVSAASNFFTVNVSGGSCPSWSTDVPMFGTFNFDFYCRPFFQNLLPWMRGVILIIFSVVAFQIAVL